MTREYQGVWVVSVFTAIISAFVLFFALPVSAATVQVYPHITNAHGGTKYAKDIKTSIKAGAFSDSQYGVPTYWVPEGSYEVTFSPPAGYSETHDSNCSGTITEVNSHVVCTVYYKDGAPIPPPVEVGPLPTGTVPVVTLPTPIVPISGTTTSSSTTGPTEAEQIQALQVQIMELYKILIALLSQKLAVVRS